MERLIINGLRKWKDSKEHKPLITIPDDMKFVRDTTYGKVILIGRHTFEYTFNAKPLPNRTVVVVTKDQKYKADGVLIAHSCVEGIELARENSEDIYILGGHQLCHDLLPICEEVHVTYVDYAYSADSWFPNLDKKPEWVLVDESEEQTHFDVVYYFRRYLKRLDYREP